MSLAPMMTIKEADEVFEAQNVNMSNARTRGKKQAVQDFLAARPQDVDALLEDAQEHYYGLKGGTVGSSYWLAYWGRMLEMRRQRIQANRVRPGQLRAI